MAEFKTLTEARNYPLTTGATADLIALIGTATLDGLTSVNNPKEVAVGDVAYVHAMGDLRRGVVTKLTKTKIYVTFTTQGAVGSAQAATAYRADGQEVGIRIQTTAAPMVWVKKAPAALAPVEIEEAPEADLVPLTVDVEGLTAQLQAEAQEEAEECADCTPEIETAPEVETEEEEAPAAPVQFTEAEECADCGKTQDEGQHEGWAGHPFRTPVEIDQPEELTLTSHGGKVDLNTENDGGEADMTSTDTQNTTREMTGSAVVKLLERVHDRIRQNHPEVPEVVIVTGAGIGFGGGKWGHFRPQGWTAQNGEDKATHIHEMFMAGETLAKGSRQVLQTMLHESAHALAEHRGEKDTSRQGRWHNQVFRKTAQELGLEYKGEKADKTLGFSQVTLTAETVEEYKDLLDALDAEIHLMVRLPGWLGGTSGNDEDEDNGGENMGKAPKTGPATSSNNVKLTCECEEPNIIRASKKVAAKMVVRCDDCESLFAERD